MFLLDKAAGELVLVTHRKLPEDMARGISRVKLGEGLPGRATARARVGSQERASRKHAKRAEGRKQSSDRQPPTAY